MASLSSKKQDVVVIGGGPAGTACALNLLKTGIKPLIMEKDRFPRYRIGESLTGEVGKMLRELGLEDAMNDGINPIKHGVTVYGTEGKNAFFVPVNKRNEQGQLEKTSTWQVRRSTFDQMLMDIALERGAELLPCRADEVIVDDDRVCGVRFRTPNGAVQEIKAEVVVDASGHKTFLANHGAPMGKKNHGGYEKQIAIFSQVVDAIRDPGDAGGDTVIFYQKKNHWAWFIPLDNEVVSIGVVVPAEYFKAQKLSKEAFLRQELHTLNPKLSERFPEIKFVDEIRAIPEYSYHIKNFTGKGFLCVGDSHRFVDPVFSFGVNVAMKEGELGAKAIAKYLSGEDSQADNPFAQYEIVAERALDAAKGMIDVFWDRPLSFLHLIQHSHREGMIDLFAGRIYSDDIMETEVFKALQKCLDKN